MTRFEALKEKFKDWNWEEAEEVNEEDLKAAQEYYDMLRDKQSNFVKKTLFIKENDLGTI